ncbi:hypothetical protein WCP94_004201 [Bilophila wadsworthia]
MFMTTSSHVLCVGGGDAHWGSRRGEPSSFFYRINMFLSVI